MRKLVLFLFIFTLCISFSYAQDSLGVTCVHEYFGDWPRADDVVVSGNYAFLSGNEGGIRSINISDPSAPVEEGTWIFDGGRTRKIWCDGSCLYVPCGTNGLYILDISNPAALTETAQLTTADNAMSVEVYGDYAYVAENWGGFSIIDVSDPAAPSIVSTTAFTWNVRHVTVQGNYAYIGNNDHGLKIMDISDPANPALVGELDTNEAGKMIISGNTLYICDDEEGLLIIDVSDPTAPTLLHQITTEDYIVNVELIDNFVIISEVNYGIKIFDVTDLTSPTLAGYYDTSGNPRGACYSSPYLYLADGNFFGVYDVSETIPTSGIVEAPNAALIEKLEIVSVYPNPFNSSSKLTIFLPNSGMLKLNVYDILGRKVQNYPEETYSQGLHTLSVNGNDLSTGMYYIEAILNDQQKSMEKLVLVK